MSKLKEELLEMGFKERGIFKLLKVRKQNIISTDYIRTVLHERDWGLTYLWVVKRKGIPIKIIYVGSTDKTIWTRCRGHERGFRGGSNPGKIHAIAIEKVISEGNTISIYNRPSAIETHFGVSVSTEKVDEMALIKKFTPRYELLNIHGKNQRQSSEELLNYLTAAIKSKCITSSINRRSCL